MHEWAGCGEGSDARRGRPARLVRDMYRGTELRVVHQLPGMFRQQPDIGDMRGVRQRLGLVIKPARVY